MGNNIAENPLSCTFLGSVFTQISCCTINNIHHQFIHSFKQTQRRKPLTDIQDHGGEDDESKPGVEGHDEENHGDRYIDERRRDREQYVGEEVIDRVCAAVHHSQDLAGLARQVPTQRQTVQVPEQLQLEDKGEMRDRSVHGDFRTGLNSK